MPDPRRNSARAQNLKAAFVGLFVAALGQASAAQVNHPTVRCHVDYGGEVRTIPAPAVSSPYGVHPVEVGSYFLFRVVHQVRPADLATVKVYVSTNDAQGPIPIHQARYHQREVMRPPPVGGHGFTGLQRVYEPVRDGELAYWCEATRSGRTSQPHRPLPPMPVLEGTGAPVAAATSPLRRTDSTLTVLFAGDVMLDDGPGKVVERGDDPLRHFDAVLREADHTIGNLETPVAESGQPTATKIYNFRAHPRVLKAMQGRFDAVSVANNHSGDYGQAAFVETLQRVRDAGVATFGGGMNLEEAHRPHWVHAHGVKLAVLGYDEFKPRRFEAGAAMPGVAWSEDEQAIADIRAARAAGADVVIPFMHWGWERERQPTERQRRLARMLIDAGADAVVGGHPHVTQGAELYRGKPIVYSLGNFVFDSFDDVPGGTTGWLLRLQIDRKGVVAWDTVVAEMDPEGVPSPRPGAASPCGKRKTTGHRHTQSTIGLCRNP